MIRRIAFDIGAIAVLFLGPWWVALAYAVIGIVLFPWFIEAVFMGLFFDAMYGSPAVSRYLREIHTLLFAVPLCIGEYVKRRINV